MFAAGAALALVALAFVVLPLFRHRREPAVGVTLTATVFLLPLCAAGLYFAVSNYPWDEKPPAAAANTSAASLPPVNEMIVELEKRMEARPDLEGLMLLGRSYMSLQRYQDAADALNRAWEMTKGESPEVNLDYAEALVLADKRTLVTSAADLLDSVLKAMPDDPRALWYGGLSAASRGMNELAIDRFTRLMQTDLPDNMRTVVQTQLAQLGADTGAFEQGNKARAAGEGASVTANVSIASELAGLVPQGAMLFVFARDGDKPGPPVAVKRLPAAQLPTTVTLTDGDAMVEGLSLAKVSELKLVARISVSGNPIAAPGDLYGEARSVTVGNGQEIEVLIDRIVE
jgi:cytochrome c-type biogenesis protein CcmH